MCPASRVSVFCWRTTCARIWAASPTHSSCPPLGQQPLEPQRGKRCFDSHSCPSRPTGVKGSRFPVFVLQPARLDLPRLFLDPRYNLVARMQITSHNVHGSAPFSANLGRYTTKFTGDSEPTPLSNQTLASQRVCGFPPATTRGSGL